MNAVSAIAEMIALFLLFLIVDGFIKAGTGFSLIEWVLG
jgi:hypothetical protein